MEKFKASVLEKNDRMKKLLRNYKEVPQKLKN